MPVNRADVEQALRDMAFEHGTDEMGADDQFIRKLPTSMLVEALEQAVEDNPGDSEANVFAGLVLAAAGRGEEE